MTTFFQTQLRNRTLFVGLGFGVLFTLSGLCLYMLLRPSFQTAILPRLTITTPTPPLISSFVPTPTLAPGQKAIYTYYVRAFDKTEPKSIGLTPFNTGRVFNVDIGSLFILNKFGIGRFDISHSSPANIFTNYGSPEVIHLPANSKGAVRVYRAGVGTIQVIESE